MIDCIILSKDRACQLHLLLESLTKNANGIFNPIALILGSNDRFREGYRQLYKITKLYPIYQASFKSDIIAILKYICKNDLVCFMTDDDIVYSLVKENEIYRVFDSGLTDCFSLRLGYNTIIQDQYRNKLSQIPNLYHFAGSTCIYWNHIMMEDHENFGYPTSVDGHIFSRKFIALIIENCEFDNPNSMEAAMCKHKNKLKPMMFSFRTSCLVNTPINRVANCNNKNGEIYGIDTEELNNKYLNNEIIDLNQIDFSNIKGCHQELEFKFKKW